MIGRHIGIRASRIILNRQSVITFEPKPEKVLITVEGKILQTTDDKTITIKH